MQVLAGGAAAGAAACTAASPQRGWAAVEAAEAARWLGPPVREHGQQAPGVLYRLELGALLSLPRLPLPLDLLLLGLLHILLGPDGGGGRQNRAHKKRQEEGKAHPG